MLPPSEQPGSTDQWARLLRGLAEQARGAGRREAQEGDHPIWPPESAIRAVHGGRSARRGDGEVRLWKTLERYQTFDAASASELLTAERLASVSGFALGGSGPLWSQDDWDAIEVWTEAELCGLHGLWRAQRVFAAQAGEASGQREREPSDATIVTARIHAAIRWHLEYTQPDNATNRPWAAHVFLHVASTGAAYAADARLYAETLLHNAQAQGMADPATAWILEDAGRELAGIAAIRRAP